MAVVRAALVLSALGSPAVRAVLFYENYDSNHNTTAPGGSLSGSGWQYQGTWGSFLGTPIGPSHFITAGHIGGTAGQIFTYNSVGYVTTGFYDDPNSDLRIWSVSGTFNSYAPLYTASDEVGKSLVVFGRGTQRGGEVTVSGGVGGDLKGWEWGAADHVQRWGENEVGAIAAGGAGFGTLLAAPFDAGAGLNEAHLSTGDSGGAVFIQDAGTWKLAGINYSVDGPYQLTLGGANVYAALFDEGGLYKDGSQVPDEFLDHPGDFYATRISDKLDWITSVVPEPNQYGLALGLSALAFAAYRRGCAKKTSRRVR